MKILAAAALAVAAITASTAAQAAGDAAAGEKVAKRCLACHSFDEGGPNKVGPNLYGIVAAGPGKVDGFKYSDDFKAAADTGFAWDDEQLAAYLADPTAFLREATGDDKARSRMTFKLPKEEDRADVVAYMKTLGGEPSESK